MEKLVRASSCPEMLLWKKPLSDKASGADGDGADAGKLNAKAYEFVPQLDKQGGKGSSKDLVKANKYPNVNAREFVPRQTKEAMTQVNADSDEDLEALEDGTVKLWKEFPNMPIKVGHGSRVVMLNDNQYMIVPRLKRGKKKKNRKYNRGTALHHGEEITSSTSSNESRSYEERLVICESKRQAVQERRREQERQVALEALKLVEQRRARAPLVPNINNDDSSEPPQPVYHLSRSPVRYTPQERTRVDHLRDAKRERIERILREMSEERKQKQQQEQIQMRQQQQEQMQKKDSSSTTTTPSSSPPQFPSSPPLQSTSKVARRYIPTDKEWDEQRRAQREAKREAKRKARRESKWGERTSPGQKSPREMTLEGLMEALTIEGGDAAATPPSNGNPANWRYLSKWPTQEVPQNLNNVKFIRRYTIEELRQLKPQPENLEMLCVEEKVRCMGFLCN
ncbi:hypothetical protein KR054_000578 [Drosophila jambulina]|nr:hypothetical protein KR054_000578 [Drosophila jambulina]